MADSAPYSDSAAHRAPRRTDRRDWAQEQPNPQATESISGQNLNLSAYVCLDGGEFTIAAATFPEGWEINR